MKFYRRRSSKKSRLFCISVAVIASLGTAGELTSTSPALAARTTLTKISTVKQPPKTSEMKVSLYNPKTQTCVDAKSDPEQFGNYVTRTCNGSASQKFSFAPAPGAAKFYNLIDASGQCLTVGRGNYIKGTECNGGNESQSIRLDPPVSGTDTYQIEVDANDWAVPNYLVAANPLRGHTGTVTDGTQLWQLRIS